MNRSGIRTEKAEATRDILFTTNPVVAVGVRVDNTGLTAGKDGKKRILAGSVLGGADNVLMERQSPLHYDPTGAAAQGVTQHDIVFYDDETELNANLIIFGFVDINKMEEDAQPSAGAITALKNRVTFVNGI